MNGAASRGAVRRPNSSLVSHRFRTSAGFSALVNARGVAAGRCVGVPA